MKYEQFQIESEQVFFLARLQFNKPHRVAVFSAVGSLVIFGFHLERLSHSLNTMRWCGVGLSAELGVGFGAMWGCLCSTKEITFRSFVRFCVCFFRDLRRN